MSPAKKKRKLPFALKVILILLVLGLGGGGYYVWDSVQAVYSPNVNLGNAESVFFYIHTGAEIQEVTDSLYTKGYIQDRATFEWVAERKNYQNWVQPGKYQLTHGMSNNDLVNLLRSGEDVKVNVTFNNIRTLPELAGKVATRIESDSTELIELFYNDATLTKYGFTRATLPAMFVPNTYQFDWNTSADQFFKRMAQEFKSFWTADRLSQAKRIGLSQSEVVTLASIVQKETNVAEERKTIAGVYMNRIEKGIPLQADPTLIWALGDFSIKRVLAVHKEVDSPYNTYKYRGLPPGPICLPEISYVDAVLNFEQHNYLYFCAREDFSGYSNFAKTYRQHLVNARKYQQALNQRKIYK